MPKLPREVVKTYQKQLAARGFDVGTPDGVYGPATRRALKACAARRCL